MMSPKDEARDWLNDRLGRKLRVETRPVNSSLPPEVREGRLTKSEDSVGLRDTYEVGLVSSNLGDLPDDLEVQVGPADQLELTFDDGGSALIKIVVTVID
jgi:hypothetical protein